MILLQSETMVMTRSTFALLLGAAALLGGACTDYGSGDAFGDLTLITTTDTAGTPDPDGYTLKIGGMAAVPIGDNDTVVATHLAIGDYKVILSGLAAGCVVAGGDTQTVYVPIGNLKHFLAVTCP